MISPVAELIQARNRPFIFATGYGSSGLPPEYRDRPALQKPFQIETLAQMIDTRAAGRDGLSLRYRMNSLKLILRGARVRADSG